VAQQPGSHLAVATPSPSGDGFCAEHVDHPCAVMVETVGVFLRSEEGKVALVGALALQLELVEVAQHLHL